MGTVFNIQKFSIHDGEGIRTCVFLKGCPLRCIWCHNPESLNKSKTLFFDKKKCTLCKSCVDICDARIIENGEMIISRESCSFCGKCVDSCLNSANEIIGREMSASEVFSEVMKDKMFYDASGGGITVTGGEPSFQPEFTLELLSLSREAGISLAMETCGTGTREFYEEARRLGTTFLFDVKCIDPDLHKRLTGRDNIHIMANLQYLFESGADVIIRMPLVPDCNDSDEDIKRLAEFLNENEGLYRYAEIMPYHSLGVGKAEKAGVLSKYAHKSAGKEEISRWCSLFSSFGTKVRVSE